METEHIHDLIIIGGGPAGLSAALYASRAGLETLLLESMMPGGKLTQTLEIENWIGDRLVEGQALAQRMADHAFSFGAKQEYGQVERIEDHESYKEVFTYNKSYKAKAIIIATGCLERKLGIPGEDEYYGRGISYCAVCDGGFYRDKVITVIGGGNTALEESDYLTRFGSVVHLVLRRDKARADKIYRDKVQANPKIKVHLSYSPTEILGDGNKVTQIVFKSNDPNRPEPMTLDTDGVFPLIGTIPNTEFIKDLPILNKAGYILTDEKMATSIPGIFAAGDVREKTLRQVITAGNDGSIAGQEVYHWLESLKA
jgi:thioredoxin reductase (NADPH)